MLGTEYIIGFGVGLLWSLSAVGVWQLIGDDQDKIHDPWTAGKPVDDRRGMCAELCFKKWEALFKDIHGLIRKDIQDELGQNPELRQQQEKSVLLRKILAETFSYDQYSVDDIPVLITEFHDMKQWIIDNIKSFVGALGTDRIKTVRRIINLSACVEEFSERYACDVGHMLRGEMTHN